MRLTRFSLLNHRRLGDLDIEVRDHLVMVGPNDVGKSSVLRCLDLLLGASTAQLYQRFVPDDFRDREQPLVIEAQLAGFGPGDEALFPDEIVVDPLTNDATLTVRLTATLDGTETLSLDRIAPGGGTGRQLSRDQVAGLGWKLLGATAASRDLREDRRNAVDDILQAIDLGDEKAAFDLLAAQFQEKLASSNVLEGLRLELATQLSKALPESLATEDLAFVPGATANSDVLSDVRLQVTRNGAPRNLAEQSDGMRALYAIALYDLVSVGAHMVGIDEPETHLHPTSQRSLARLLRNSGNQKFIATHSTDIVGAFEPECIVAIRAGGDAVQPDQGFLSNEERLSVEWWVRDKLEPLTARRVVAVEGISDRIILEKVADLTGRTLDRLGISIVETGGSGNMGAIITLFGKSGFDIPLSLLIDADAMSEIAARLGVSEADLNRHSTWVSQPDLEAEYVSALGASTVWSALSSSPLFSSNELTNCTRSGAGGTVTDGDVAAFCRRSSKYKVRSAIVVSHLLDPTSAAAIASINRLLNEITTT